MATAFNLTAQLNLRGPNNVNKIVADIKKQLSGITANVNLKIDPNVAKNVKGLDAALKSLNSTLNQTTKNASSASSAISAFARSVQSVSIKNIPSQINATVASMNKLNKTSNNVGKALNESATEMQEFGKQAGLAIRRFAAFTAVTGAIYSVTNSITQGIQAYIDYDKELVRLQQVTGETAAGLKLLQQSISQLATGLGVSSKELTTVSVTLAQAGLSAKDTERALRALALSSLAPSFDDMNETVEGSIALMRQFGISAGQLEQALGSVNAVAAAFAVEADDLITAIQRTGGVFATASKGVSEGTDALNEFISVFTSVRATTRESAETIATGLRTIFTRIQRGQTIDALKEFGVNLTDAEGKFVGAYKAVQLLSEGLSKLDPRDLNFSRIVEELGGFRQIGKVIPLIQQFSTAQEALKVAQAGQGSLAKDAATAQLSLANQIQKVREEFFALFREIGQSKGFQSLVSGVLTLTSGLIKLADVSKGLLPALSVILAFKGASALTQFASGFNKGFRPGAGGGASGANAERPRFGSGGRVRYFANGGYVPGSGTTDSVPAMLTPGEFVIRKKAVETIGADRLRKMNKYATGGPATLETVSRFAGGKREIPRYISKYPSVLQPADEITGKIDRKTISFQEIENYYSNTNNAHKQFANFVSERGRRYEKSMRQRPAAARGYAFEDFIGEYLIKKEGLSGYTKTKDKYAPLDFVGGGDPIEVRFRKDITPDETILAKRLRHSIKYSGLPRGFTEFIDNKPPVDVGSTILYQIDPNYKEALGFASGGKIHKFMAGGATAEKIPDQIARIAAKNQASILDTVLSEFKAIQGSRLKEKLKIPNAVKLPRVPDLEKGVGVERVKELLNQYLYITGSTSAAAETRNAKKHKVAIAGLFPLDYSTDFPDWKLSDGKEIYGIVRGFGSQFLEDIQLMQQRTMAARDEFAANIQNREALGLLGTSSVAGPIRPLAIDFDETLALGTKLTKVNAEGRTIEDIPAYRDRTKVAASLASAKPTALANRLAEIEKQNPGVVRRYSRILTARPPETADLIASALNRFGLPYTKDDITGLGKDTSVDIPRAKAFNLTAFEKLIDDSEDNIRAVRAAKKDAFHYGEIQSINMSAAEVLGQSMVDASVLEGALGQSLGYPIDLAKLERNRAVDFPQGLGRAAQYFGIPPNIETEVKRTLDKDAFSKARDEFSRYFTENPDKFSIGGLVQGFEGGSTGGVKDRSTKNRRRGAYGQRGFVPLNSREYEAFADKAYIEAGPYGGPGWGKVSGVPMPKALADYAEKINRYVFETGGAGLSLGKKLVKIPDDIDPEALEALKEDLIRQYDGWYSEIEEVLPFGRSVAMQSSTASAAKDARFRAAMMAEAGNKAYTSAEDSIANFKKTGTLTPFDPAIDSHIKSSFPQYISELESSLKSETDSDEKASIQRRLKKAQSAWPDYQALLSGTPVANQGRVTALSETLNTLLERYGSPVSSGEVDNIIKAMGSKLMSKNLGGMIARFVNGGKADYYSLEKSSGLSSGEFDSMVRYAKTNDFSLDEFKAYLNKRAADKKSRVGSVIDPKSLQSFLMHGATGPRLGTGDLTDEQKKLAEMLKGPPDPQYDPNRFANGGSVPALVSNGEAYIPPKLAKRIGYGTLNKMNQADRNGMGRFSKGGISIFKGPGTGTSDSIKTSLPVGSFILREKATKALGFNKGGSVPRFAFGGGVSSDISRMVMEWLSSDMVAATKPQMSSRPDVVSRSSVRATDETTQALDNLVKSLNAIGLSAANSAEILRKGGDISYKTIEKALTKDIERLKISGAGIDSIVAAETTLANIRKERTTDVDKQKNLQGLTNQRGSATTKILGGQTIADLQSGSGAGQQAIDAQAQMLIQSRLKRIGGNVTQEQRSKIMESSYLDAASRVTGIKKRDFKDAGISGSDIQKYIGQSMKDRKLLSQMDKQLVAIKLNELRNSTAFAAASAQEQQKMLAEAQKAAQEEISVRRKIINDLASQNGEKGVGAAGMMDFRNSPIMNQLKNFFKSPGRVMGGISIASGLVAGSSDMIARNMYNMSTTEGQGRAARTSAGLQSAGTILSTGMATASQMATLPGIGPALAGITAVGTAALAAADYFYDFTGSQKAAAIEFERAVRAKEIGVAMDGLDRAFQNFQKEVGNIDLQKALEKAIGTASAAQFNDNMIERDNARTEFSLKNRTWADIFTGNFGGSAQMSLADEKAMDSEMSQNMAMVADRAMALYETQINQGKSIEDIIDNVRTGDKSAVDAGAAVAFAADPALWAKVERQVKASGDASEENRTKILRNLVAESLASNEQLKTAERAKKLADAMDAADRAGRRLAQSFQKITDTIDQAINRVQKESEIRQAQASSMMEARRGNAGFDAAAVNNQNIGVLTNPRAYDPGRIEDAIRVGTAGMSPELSQKMAGGARLEASLPDVMRDAIEDGLKANANLSLEDVAGQARERGLLAIRNSGLSAEDQRVAEDKLIATINAQEDKARKENTENPTQQVNAFADAISDLGPEIARIFGNAGRSLDNIISQRQNIYNTFAKNLEMASDAARKARDYFNKARDIRYNSRMDLREAQTGVSESYDEAKAKFDDDIKRLTGGVTDPAAIGQNIDNLMKQRQQQIDQRDAALSDPTLTDEKRKEATAKFAQDLQSTNNALNDNREALEKMANSADLAQKALDSIKNIRGLQQNRENFVNQLLTNTPEEADKLNQSLIRLQRNLSGGLNNASNQRDAQNAFRDTLRRTGSLREATRAGNTVLADQRKQTLQLMQDPGFRGMMELNMRNRGMSSEQVDQTFRYQEGNLMRQMAVESGMINNPMVRQALAAKQDPNADPAMKRAAEQFLQATGLQAKATEEQGRLELANVQTTLITATDDLNTSIRTLIDTINNNGAAANGGGVDGKVPGLFGPMMALNNRAAPLGRMPTAYASAGRLIDFKPKGTDTVPAMLTPGEFVVNAKSTAQHLPLLQAINSGSSNIVSRTMNKGGVVYLNKGTNEPIEDNPLNYPGLNPDQYSRNGAPMSHTMTGLTAGTDVPNPPGGMMRYDKWALDRDIDRRVKESEQMSNGGESVGRMMSFVDDVLGGRETVEDKDRSTRANSPWDIPDSTIDSLNRQDSGLSENDWRRTQGLPPIPTEAKTESAARASEQTASMPQTSQPSIPANTAVTPGQTQTNAIVANVATGTDQRTISQQQSTPYSQPATSSFKETDAQMYARQAYEASPRNIQDFRKPRNAAEVQMYREGLMRGMTIDEIKYERQQAYLSRFDGKTRASKERQLGRNLISEPTRMGLMRLSAEAQNRTYAATSRPDPYADQNKVMADRNISAANAVTPSNETGTRAPSAAAVQQEAQVQKTTQQAEIKKEEQKQTAVDTRTPQDVGATSSTGASPISQKKAELIAGIYNGMIPKVEDAPKEGDRNALGIIMKLRAQKSAADAWYQNALNMSEKELEQIAGSQTPPNTPPAPSGASASSSTMVAENAKAQAQAEAEARMSQQEAQKSQRVAAEAEQKRKDSMWINSSNPLWSGLGYLAGVAEGAGNAAYGAANVVAGTAVTAAGAVASPVINYLSGSSQESAKAAELDSRIRENQRRQAEAGVLGEDLSVAQSKVEYQGPTSAQAFRQVGLDAAAQGAYTAVELAQAVAAQGPIQTGEQTALFRGDAERVQMAREGFGEPGALLTGLGQNIGYIASQGVQMATGAGFSTGTSLAGKLGKGLSVIDNIFANPGTVTSGIGKILGLADNVALGGRLGRIASGLADDASSFGNDLNSVYQLSKPYVSAITDTMPTFKAGIKGVSDAFSGFFGGVRVVGDEMMSTLNDIFMSPTSRRARASSLRSSRASTRSARTTNRQNDKNILKWLDQQNAMDAADQAAYEKFVKNSSQQTGIRGSGTSQDPFTVPPTAGQVNMSQQTGIRGAGTASNPYTVPPRQQTSSAFGLETRPLSPEEIALHKQVDDMIKQKTAQASNPNNQQRSTSPTQKVMESMNNTPQTSAKVTATSKQATPAKSASATKNNTPAAPQRTREQLIEQLSSRQATIYDMIGSRLGQEISLDDIKNLRNQGSRWLHPDLPLNKDIDPGLQKRLNSMLELASDPKAMSEYEKGIKRGFTNEDLMEAWRGSVWQTQKTKSGQSVTPFNIKVLKQRRPDLYPQSQTPTQPPNPSAAVSKPTSVAPQAKSAPAPGKPKPKSAKSSTPTAQPTPRPVSKPPTETEQLQQINNQIAALKSQERKGRFGFGRVSKQDEIDKLVRQKRRIEETIAIRETIARGAKNLEIERQGLGASFYQGEEWKRLLEGGIPNEYRISGYRTEGFGGSSIDQNSLEAFGRLREAAAESRGIMRPGSSGHDLGGFDSRQWDPTTKTFLDFPNERSAPEFMTKKHQRPQFQTGYTIDEKGNLYISGEQYSGTTNGQRKADTRDGLLYNIPADEVTPELLEKIKKLGIQKFNQGGIVYASNGALVSARPQGPDTVPAMLTPGEFVVKRDQAQKHMPLLNAINSGAYSRGGIVNYMANGGLVDPVYLAAGGYPDMSDLDKSRNPLREMSKRVAEYNAGLAPQAPQQAPAPVPAPVPATPSPTSGVSNSVGIDTSGATAIVDGLQKTVNQLVSVIPSMSEVAENINGSIGSFVSGGAQVGDIMNRVVTGLKEVNIPDTINVAGTVSSTHTINGAEAASRVIDTFGPTMEQVGRNSVGRFAGAINRGIGNLAEGVLGPDTGQIMGQIGGKPYGG